MSKEDPDLLQHYHDKGEQDCAEGKGYNLPNTSPLLGEVLNQKYEDEQNAAYRKGYTNTQEQNKKK